MSLKKTHDSISSPSTPSPEASTPTASAVQQHLRNSAYGPLRTVQCIADADAVILCGRVPSFYLKQLAQEIVRKTDGACEIVNDLEVDWRSAEAAFDDFREDSERNRGESNNRSTKMQGCAEASDGSASVNCG